MKRHTIGGDTIVRLKFEGLLHSRKSVDGSKLKVLQKCLLVSYPKLLFKQFHHFKWSATQVIAFKFCSNKFLLNVKGRLPGMTRTLGQEVYKSAILDRSNVSQRKNHETLKYRSLIAVKTPTKIKE